MPLRLACQTTLRQPWQHLAASAPRALHSLAVQGLGIPVWVILIASKPYTCMLTAQPPGLPVHSRGWASRPGLLHVRMAATAHPGETAAAVVVYVTVPDVNIAKSLGNSIVNAKLAACVNIIPGLESVYLWEGTVNTDSELLLMIKSRQALIPELTAHVKQNHPYTECEVIAVPIVGGSPSYIKWILDSTKDA